MKSDYEIALIIDDDDIVNDNKKINNVTNNKLKIIRTKEINILEICYIKDDNIYEIGVDESGRGPLFGRVYTAAVILPKNDIFDFTKVKDSKKFHSKKKIEEVAEYIKQHALSWYVSFEDEKKIDEINILQATQLSMHNSINNVIKKFNEKTAQNQKYHLLIDGNYFNPLTKFNKQTEKFETIPYKTIEGGDNKYASIAAASILAKVERDNYIYNLCNKHPELIQNYGIDSNKGYGSKKHLEGIEKHGITIWHRRSFAPCKKYI